METAPFSALYQFFCCSLLFVVLTRSARSKEGHSFVCLDTVSQCACDPTKLSVDCSNLGFRQVPLDDIPTATSSLALGGNLLTAVLEDTFATLESLYSLSLENNLIAYVGPLSFNGTRELRYLDLSGNRLATVPSALSVLTSLKVLNLSGNGLSYLSPDDFQSFTQLQTLKLENNELYSIPETIFHPLTNLNVLYMDGNFISAEPVGWFANNSLLTELRMSHNLLTLTGSVEDWFGVGSQFVPLEKLRLANNDIPKISEATFKGCVNLTELNLSANEIETIEPDSFSDLTKLQSLTLDSNQLYSLPENLFEYTMNLVNLSLVENFLSEMTRDVFNGLGQLVNVNLSGNRLVDLFTSCGSDGCAVDQTGISFLPAMRSLNLQFNSLSYVPDVRNFLNLEVLDLSDNDLVGMESYVFNGTSLQLLYLHDNLLTTMSLENFQFLPDLEVVTITGNPWTCDCRLFWVTDPDGEDLEWKTAVRNDIVCKSPDVARDLNLDTLYLIGEGIRKSGPFAACETANWLTIVIIIVVWVAVAALLLLCYLSHSFEYRKGYFKRKMKEKVVKRPPPPPTPPATSTTAACLNEGASFDEQDKTNTTDVPIHALSPKDDEPSSDGQTKERQQSEETLPVTVISVV